jgi:putative transposase
MKFNWAKQLYYNLLLRFKSQYKISFYSYMIMDNHIHLSGSLNNLEQFSAFFRIVNSMFAKEVNKRMKRYGQVVRDRFKSPCLQTEKDLLQEMIYHDLNEVRASKVKHPRENEMSSYAHYANGKPDPLITNPEVYIKMGSTSEARQYAYRAMVQEILIAAPSKVTQIRRKELFIGDPHWVAKKYERLKTCRAELRKSKPAPSLSPPKPKPKTPHHKKFY